MSVTLPRAVRERMVPVRPGVRWALGHAVPRTAIGVAARRGDLHSRLVLASAESGDAPYELFDTIRAAGPMVPGKFAWMTAHQPVVREVLASPDVHAGVEFGNGGGLLGQISSWAKTTAPPHPLRPPSLLATEPPDHTRMRKLVTRVFSVKAVRELRARTEQIATGLLRDLPGARVDGVVDLVSAYCAPLPVTVIAEILGVPDDEFDTVLHFGSSIAASLDLGLSWHDFTAVETALGGFFDWLDGHVEAKRRTPGDDLLSQLIAARDDDGVALTDEELKSTAGLVLAAGFETTVNLLGNGVALLDAHPDQRQLLVDQPEHWPTAVDEVLRMDPPVLLTGRTVLRDTEIAGVVVRRGEVVTVLLAAANRDPAVFTDPDRFDVTRANAADHVSFSSGRHYCLGAALARMEGEVGLRRLLEAYPDLRVLPGARRRETRILRGFAELPVALD